jgi:hypothetical protein
MSFKLNNPPYEDNKVKVYKVPMEEGVLGKANNMASSNEGFSIHINQKVNSTPKYNEVVNHENGHIDQMNRGDLAYDDDKVVWKGKEHSRENMPEGDHDLEWEKEIYDEQQNNSPMAFKLRKGQGNNTPFANLTNRGLIKSAPLKNKVDYNHDGNNTNDGNNVGETETAEEKKARLAKEAKENAQNNMQVVNTTVNTLEDGTIQTIEDLEGEGEAEGYHVGKEKMGNEEWKAWLKTPEGQKYTASKKVTDQRITLKPPGTKEPNYSYLDGATFGEGYTGGDFATHGLQVMSKVGDDDPRNNSQQREGEDPMSRYLTQPELDYLKKKQGWKGDYYAGYDTYYGNRKPDSKTFKSGVSRGLIDEKGKTIPLNPVKEKLDESKNLASEIGVDLNE